MLSIGAPTRKCGCVCDGAAILTKKKSKEIDGKRLRDENAQAYAREMALPNRRGGIFAPSSVTFLKARKLAFKC